MAKIAITPEGAKTRLRAARESAKRANPLMGAMVDRLYSETLAAMKGQAPERLATMAVRMSVCLEVLAEYRGWPERVVGLPDRALRSRRAEAEAVFDDVEHHGVAG